jgi:hypothetical protein
MKTIIFIIAFTLNVNAQVIGFTIGGVGIKTDQHYKIPWPIPFTSFSLLAGAETVPKLYIEARVGYQLLLYHYIGWDFAGYLIYDIAKPLYITGSMTFHDNSHWEGGALANSIFLIGFGAGVQLGKNVSLEADYSFPLTKEPWFYFQKDINDNFIYENLIGVLKLHFKFHWTL